MKKVNCIEFVDRPIFEIDGKEYSLDLEGSKMMKDVYEYLDSLTAKDDDYFTITSKGIYAIQGLGKLLALTVAFDCEAAEYDRLRYVVAHMAIDKAVLLGREEVLEPEIVTELK